MNKKALRELSLLEKVGEYALLIIFLLLVTLLITDFTLFRSNSIFTSGIGDGTSGFTYLLYADQDLNPAWAHTNLINYPYGENLGSPVYITWFLVMAPLWVLAKISSPIVAMNIMTVVGYVSSGLITYWLIKRVTKKRSLALLAAYGIAFVPYHVVKSTDHLTNVFNWVVIAVIASFVAVWRVQTWLRMLLLACAVAAAFYTDGYYIFICGVLLLALLIAAIATDILIGVDKKIILNKVSAIVGAGLITLLLLVPILYVQIVSSKDINSNFSNARSNIQSETQYYGSRPIDFILPVENPLVENQQWYKDALATKKDRSVTESASYLGVMPTTLYILGIFIILLSVRMFRKNKTINLTLQQHLLFIAVLAVPLVIVWMLPPTAQFMGYTIRFPMAYLIEVTAYWRVPSRVILALQPLVIIAAVLSLSWLINKLKLSKKNGYIVIGVVGLLVALEYLTVVNRPPFSTSMMPKAYTWLRQQDDIKAVAELPIFDRPIEVSGYYVFAQMIHNKPIVNSSLSKAPIGMLNPLGYDSNPETINFVKARGVDAVITHGKTCERKDWGTLVYREANTLMPPHMKQKKGDLCIYRIINKGVVDNYYPYALDGFNRVNYLETNEQPWLIIENGKGVISVVDQQGKLAESNMVRIEATLDFLGEFKQKQLYWSLLQDGKLIAKGDGFGEIGVVGTIDSSKDVELIVRVDSNLLVPANGEIGVKNLQVKQL